LKNARRLDPAIALDTAPAALSHGSKDADPENTPQEIAHFGKRV
jgi:hypothetical protein